jgi:hypothetical protein
VVEVYPDKVLLDTVPVLVQVRQKLYKPNLTQTQDGSRCESGSDVNSLTRKLLGRNMGVRSRFSDLSLLDYCEFYP